MQADQSIDIYERFQSSFGGWSILAAMMENLEFLKLQVLSKRAYKTNISRVQMKWKVKLPDQPICALYSDRALYIRDDKSGIWKRNKSDWFHLDHTAKYVIVGQSLLGFCSGGIVHPY